MTALKTMFVVRPYKQDGDDLPIIYKVPNEMVKLFQCGIQESAQIVVCNLENDKNISAALYAIGHHFEIPIHEIRAILPEVEIEFKPNELTIGQSSVTDYKPLTHSNLNKFDHQENQKANFYDGFDFEPPQSNKNIPDEYANDPELWYAIQASMGEEVQSQG